MYLKLEQLCVIKTVTYISAAFEEKVDSRAAMECNMEKDQEPI